VLEKVILNHSIYMPKFIEYNLKTGKAIEVEEPIKHKGYYNQLEDKTFWGYFWGDKEPYFFHGKNVYPIFYVGNEVTIELKLSFRFSKMVNY